MTLLELVIVMMILVALAGAVVAVLPGVSDNAVETTTDSSLTAIGRAIVGGADGGGLQAGPAYRADLLALPATIADLLRKPTGASDFDPATRVGWRGPYLMHRGGRYSISGTFTADYGADDDPAMLDGWGNPIVLQFPTRSGTDFSDEEKQTYVRLISAGPDGAIDTPASELMPSTTARGDDRVLFLNVADTP